jgi:hypothetical protein
MNTCAAFNTRLFFISNLVIGWWFILSTCQAQPSGNQHSRAPEPGTYKSSRMTSWVTFTPRTYGDPRYGTTTPNGNFGVGSTSFKGLFGDLVLHKDGTYSLTEDKHGGTWRYIPEKDSVTLTGWLSTFKTKYDYGKQYIVIYTGDVKMPDGDKLNISYTKKREKP